MSCPKCKSPLRRQEEGGVIFDGCMMCGHRRYLTRIEVLKEVAIENAAQAMAEIVGLVCFREIQEVLGGRMVYIPTLYSAKRRCWKKNRERDRAIVAAYREGIKVEALSKKHALNPTTIYYILKRENALAR